MSELNNLYSFWGPLQTEIIKRYAHLAPEQFKKHAEVVDGLLIDTNLTQLENHQVKLIT